MIIVYVFIDTYITIGNLRLQTEFYIYTGYA